MNAIVFALSIMFIPLAIPIVAFYASLRMVLNGLNKMLDEMGSEL